MVVDRTPPLYEFPAKVADDVFFDLVELDKVAFGQPFSVTVHVQNRATEMRSVAAILSASSIYYTGVPARRLGRTDRQLVLQPGQRKSPLLFFLNFLNFIYPSIIFTLKFISNSNNN